MPDRFFDALVGSSVASGINALFPNDPRRMVEQAAHPIIDELIVMLGETTAALHADDLKLAEHAFGKAGELDARVGGLQRGPGRWVRDRAALPAQAAGPRVSRPLRSRRGPAGPCGAEHTGPDPGCLQHAAGREHAPEQLSEALLDLARAVETLGVYLQRFVHLETRHFALKAAESATSALKECHDLETFMLVGQIQSTAVDLLHASGMDYSESRQALREAAHHSLEKRLAADG